MHQADKARRHDRVWLQEGWARRLAVPLLPHDQDAVDEWSAAGRPFVTARRHEDDAAGTIRLGLALPRKRRVGMLVDVAAIARCAPPVPLSEVLPVLASSACSARRVVSDEVAGSWCKALSALDGELTALELPPRVFGSLAWQYAAADAGLVYLTATSDADLLLYPRSWHDVERLAEILGAIQERYPLPRLDGEFLLPDGGAVNWRELGFGATDVLVKSLAGARLRPVYDVRAMFAGVRP